VVLELAETPREGDLLGRREPLAAKGDDLMLEKGVRDRGERGIVQGLRKIGAQDFRADMLAYAPDRDHRLQSLR